MARIFAARQSSPGSSTVVFTVSLSVRFAANTESSVSTHTAKRQDSKTVKRVHTFTSTRIHMQAEKRLYGFTGQDRIWGQTPFSTLNLGSDPQHSTVVSAVGEPGKIVGAPGIDPEDDEFGDVVGMERADSRFEGCDLPGCCLDQQLTLVGAFDPPFPRDRSIASPARCSRTRPIVLRPMSSRSLRRPVSIGKVVRTMMKSLSGPKPQAPKPTTRRAPAPDRLADLRHLRCRPRF